MIYLLQAAQLLHSASSEEAGAPTAEHSSATDGAEQLDALDKLLTAPLPTAEEAAHTARTAHSAHTAQAGLGDAPGSVAVEAEVLDSSHECCIKVGPGCNLIMIFKIMISKTLFPIPAVLIFLRLLPSHPQSHHLSPWQETGVPPSLPRRK